MHACRRLPAARPRNRGATASTGFIGNRPGNFSHDGRFFFGHFAPLPNKCVRSTRSACAETHQSLSDSAPAVPGNSTAVRVQRTKKSAARISSRRHRFLASTVFALCLDNEMRQTANATVNFFLPRSHSAHAKQPCALRTPADRRSVVVAAVVFPHRRCPARRGCPAR